MRIGRKTPIALLVAVLSATLAAAPSLSTQAVADTGDCYWADDPNNPGSQILIVPPSGQCAVILPGPTTQPPGGGSSGGSSDPSHNPSSNMNSGAGGSNIPVATLRTAADVTSFFWTDSNGVAQSVSPINSGNNYSFVTDKWNPSINAVITFSDGASATIDGVAIKSGVAHKFFLDGSSGDISRFNLVLTSEDQKTVTTKAITIQNSELPANFGDLQYFLADKKFGSLSGMTRDSFGNYQEEFKIPASNTKITFTANASPLYAFDKAKIVRVNSLSSTPTTDLIPADQMTTGATYTLASGYNSFQLQAISPKGVAGPIYQLTYWVSDDPLVGPSDSRLSALSVKVGVSGVIGAAGTTLAVPGFTSTQQNYNVFIPHYWPSYSDTSHIAFQGVANNPLATLTAVETTGEAYYFQTSVTAVGVGGSTSRIVTAKSGDITGALPTNFGDNPLLVRHFLVTVTSSDKTHTTVYNIGIGQSDATDLFDTLQYKYAATDSWSTFPGYTSPDFSKPIYQSTLENSMFAAHTRDSVTIYPSFTHHEGAGTAYVWGGAGSTCAALAATCTIKLHDGANTITATPVPGSSPETRSGVKFNFGIINTITIYRAAATTDSSSSFTEVVPDAAAAMSSSTPSSAGPASSQGGGEIATVSVTATPKSASSTANEAPATNTSTGTSKSASSTAGKPVNTSAATSTSTAKTPKTPKPATTASGNSASKPSTSKPSASKPSTSKPKPTGKK